MESKKLIELFDSGNLEDYMQFELIEHFSDHVSCEDDVFFLVRVLRNDPNGIIRHEAAAQLLKVDEKKTWLIDKCREFVEDNLIETSLYDSSIVSRHEAIESLSRIGRQKSLEVLTQLLLTEKNEEIIQTIKISMGIISYKISRGLTSVNLNQEIAKSKLASV